VFTNEEGMISDIDYGAKLGNSSRKVLKFDFNCYCKSNKNEPRKFNYDEGCLLLCFAFFEAALSCNLANHTAKELQ